MLLSLCKTPSEGRKISGFRMYLIKGAERGKSWTDNGLQAHQTIKVFYTAFFR